MSRGVLFALVARFSACLNQTMFQKPDAGQPIIMGLPGPGLTDGLRELIRQVQPGGFILFARNLQGAAQVFELITELRGLCRREPVICLDQEGGRVSRLCQIGEQPPSAQQLAATDRLDWIQQHGEICGTLMRALGFNLNLAPVLDFMPSPDRDNSLGDRCYGTTPEAVVQRARAFVTGLQATGILATGKHFPGYSYCQRDPHGDLPVVQRSRDEMEAEEITVFRQFLDLPAMMVGHGWFPKVQRDDRPASLSPSIVRDWLVEALGYRGVVMTDDLEMLAVAERYSAAESARLAIEAGHHLMLICHNPAAVQLARRALDELPEDTLAPALETVEGLRRAFPPPPAAFDQTAWDQAQRRVRELRQACLETLRIAPEPS